MFKILKYLFLPENGKKSSDNSVEEDPEEKKKCKKCLRRVDFKYLRCPYCRGTEFYDS